MDEQVGKEQFRVEGVDIAQPQEEAQLEIVTNEQLDAAADDEQQKTEVPNVPPIPQRVTECAFLVFKDDNGRWTAHSDLNVQISTVREAMLDDFYVAASSIMRDVQVAETVRSVIGTQQQMAQQAMQQLENQRIAQAMNDPEQLKKIEQFMKRR